MRNGRRRSKKVEISAFEEATSEAPPLPPEIAEIASRIRDEFARQRDIFTGTTTATPAMGKPFITAAWDCLRRGDNPELYTALICEVMMASGVMYPQGLVASKFRQLAAAGRDERTNVRLGFYRAQLDRFTTMLRFGSAASILRDHIGPGYTPLLRYVMAVRFGLQDIEASSRDAARHELLVHPVAGEVFGEYLKGLQ